MALIVPGESANILSNLEDNKQIDEGVATTKDTFVNRTSIQPERYSDAYGTLLGYASGSPIITEYYHNRLPLVNKQTRSIDISSSRHSVHSDYLLIHDMELRLDGELDIVFDPETTETAITGRALTYPGFEPVLGDVFLYQIPDSQLGIFAITNIERLAINQGTYHKVSFTLHAFSNEPDLLKLNTSVNDEAYFDKEKFLTGDVSLLSTQGYVDLVELKRYRVALMNYYFNKFYHNDSRTFFKPIGDGEYVYDPYLVQYMLFKLSYTDHHSYPTQLHSQLVDYEDSFWSMISEGTHADISLIIGRYLIIPKYYYTYDTQITALINKEYILLDNENDPNFTATLLEEDELETDYYVLSQEFYEQDTLNMSDLEIMLTTAITDGTVDAALLITMLENYKSLSEIDKFYYIPIYFYLIDLAIKGV